MLPLAAHAVLYFHAICTEYAWKVRIMQAAGFWLMQGNPDPGGGLPRLRPAEAAAQRFLKCSEYPLAFTQSKEPPKYTEEEAAGGEGAGELRGQQAAATKRPDPNCIGCK